MKYIMKDYMVNELAKFYGVSGDTVRHYDRKGILQPHKDEETNYRKYGREDLFLLDYVMRLRRLGIHLEEIDKIMNQYSMEEIRESLLQQKLEISKQIEDLQRIKDMLSDYTRTLDDFTEHEGKLQIREMPAFISMEMTSSAKEIMENFAEAGINDIPILTYNLPAEKFLDKHLVISLDDRETRSAVLDISYVAIDFDNIHKKIDLASKGFQVIPPGKYLYYAEQLDIYHGESAAPMIAEHVRKNHLNVKYPFMTRSLIIENEKNIDSYEYWIRLE